MLTSGRKSEIIAHIMNKGSCQIDRWFKSLALVIASMSVTISIGFSQQDSILFFVSDNDTYYSEYVVMFESLIASGYYVDVRNAGSTGATMYTIGGDIVAQANGLTGSSYADFQGQFLDMYGVNWNEALNSVPTSIPVADSIQAVASISRYKALVVAGGTGAVDFRIDGTYAAQGTVHAQRVQSAAEKLNQLAVEALMLGKVVVGQCHGASVPAFWRVPNTTPEGFDNLGHSLLEGSIATGYPEAATAGNLADLNITFQAEDKVVIGTPHTSLEDDGSATFRIVTTRDWYPQTVAHAAKTLINMITSYPETDIQIPVSVLIIHGGEVDLGNCGAGNRSNDVPCNYGINPASNIPADYTDLVSLYLSDDFPDDFTFSVSDVDLYGTPPFNTDDEIETLTYLENFDVVIFYKHWSDSVTIALQQAIVEYADNGGGVVSVHHGLYNENKSILVDSLFGAHSPQAGWSGTRTSYNIFHVNYGHFVSSYGIANEGVSSAPAAWIGNPLLMGSNRSQSVYHRFEIFDEIYNNMQFIPGVNFGDGVNEINPIFSNDQTPGSQSHVHGFVKLVNLDGDAAVGRVVYASPGETITNYQHPHPYAQFLRNAVVWARGEHSCSGSIATWTAGNGQWGEGGNWSGGVVPDVCSNVVIPDQVMETTISIPAAADIQIHLLDVGQNVIFDIPLGTTFMVLGN